MSEEVLKALMQLFAIIARQDISVIEGHDKFVFEFLSSQLSDERTSEYIGIYHDFLKNSRPDSSGTESKDKNRTSMKDSVRTLAICKKINKTLTQKQKVIVLIRLLEFFKKDTNDSRNRIEIIDTVGTVFNIEKEEFQEIKTFVFENQDSASSNEIIVGEDSTDIQCRHFIPVHNYHGLCKFIYIKSINVIVLKYHGTQELYLNGIVIKPEDIYPFPPGSTLRLPQTTIYFSNIIARFLEEQAGESFTFSADIRQHVFPGGKQALQEVCFTETSGHLVGIMGASGSGKTTLLTLLSGQEKPSKGTIKINGIDLHLHKKKLKGIIGYVPQDDLLIEDLTVYQNLFYNARLCFKDLDENEISFKVNRTLVALGLEEIKNIKVGNALNKKISGGQRKRLNIALELIREPHILFLDEPTSGLSSKDSENVLDLLKELSFKGKLIFIVIHQPSSDIFKMMDKMLILDVGGYPIYYGNPLEAVTYFKRITHQINADVCECYACGSVNPETIFNLIELKEIDEYGNYTDKRRLKPQEFHKLHKDSPHHSRNEVCTESTISSNLEIPNKIQQSRFFFLRDFRAKLANKQYLLINLLEVPVLALLLSLIIRYTDKNKGPEYTYFNNYNIPAYFFMSVIVALLVGLTISAEEIYKDQKILKREKFLHLSRMAYLSSKVALLFGISLIQTALFLLIGNSVLGISDNHFNFFLMLFSVFAFANILGLILSSSFNSPVTIYIIIPLVIIPQLLLGGAMFSYDKLNALFGGGHRVPPFANVMVSRWAYEGLMTDMFVNNSFEKERFTYDKIESKLNYKLTYLIPKIEELLDDKNSSSLTLKNIKEALIKDYRDAAVMQFEHQPFNLEKKEELREYIQHLKELYNQKFADITSLKDRKINELTASFGNAGNYTKFRNHHQNKRLEEIVTSALEKEKIAYDENGLVQVIDPVFREPDPTQKFFGVSTHFFSPVKYLFNRLIPTFYFNLLVIWIINAIAFVVLYFDVFKRMFKRFSLI